MKKLLTVLLTMLIASSALAWKVEANNYNGIWAEKEKGRVAITYTSDDCYGYSSYINDVGVASANGFRFRVMGQCVGYGYAALFAKYTVDSNRLNSIFRSSSTVYMHFDGISASFNTYNFR